MRFSSSNGRGNSFSRGRKGRGGNQARRALKSRRVEQLEPRQMLTVTMNPINNVQLPGGQVTYVPLTGIDSAGQPITYTFKTTDPNVTLSLQSTTSKTLVLNVSGTDNTGTAFTGTLELHLFEDLAPQTTAHIESLVSSGFYTGKDFFRVIDGFVAQNNGSSGTNISVEPSAEAPFTSPGLLSLANNGSTGDAQFFVTAIDKAGSTTPIPLAEMPQFLQQGSNHFTVFGQLVSGFDTFEKIMSTTVQAQSDPNFGGEVSSPTHPITITSASLISDTQNAVLKITAPASFDGNSAIITVTATGSGGATTQKVFTTSVVVDPPKMAPVANQTTTATTPVTFTLQSGLNDQNSGAVYRIFDANTLSAPTNATVSINQSTGQVTITPNPGFKGTLNLLAGVRSGSASDIPVNYDTQAFTLTVTANPAIKPTLGTFGNQTTAEGLGVSFTLTSTDNGANGVVYRVADASTFSDPANATVTINQTTGLVTVTPKAGFSGTINLIAGVRSQTDPDTQASYATQTFTLTVLAPVLSPVGNQTIAEGAEDDFTLSATDPVGHGLVYNIVDPTTHQPPANFTTTVDAAGNVTLTPVPSFTGSVNLVAEVRSADSPDVQANYVTQAFTLNVVAPTLSAVTDQTTAMGAADSFTLSATDPIGHGLVYQIVDPTTKGPPANVTVNVDPSGHVTLTPAPGFNGSANLLAEVRSSDSPDDQADYVTQAFTLNVVAPTLDPVGAKASLAGVPLSFNLPGHDTIGNGLVYKVTGDQTNVDIVVNGSTVTLTPHAGFSGSINLTAAVRDITSPDVPENYVTRDFPFSVAALNQVGPQTTILGTPISFDLTTSPANQGGFFFNIFDGNSFNTPSSNVTVVVDHDTGHVTITPKAGFTGTVSLRAAMRSTDAVDDPANYDTVEFDLTVNPGPTVDDIGNQTTTRGTPITIPVTLGNVPAEGVSYALFDSTGTNKIADATVEPGDTPNTIKITPNAGFIGTINDVLLGVRDQNAVDDPANYNLTPDTFNITVDDSPTMDPVVAPPTFEGTPIVDLQLSASGVNGDGTFFKFFNLPAGMAQPVIDQATGTVTITPPPGFTGTLTLTVGVRGGNAVDDPANYSTQDFDVTVNPGPVLAPVGVISVPLNAPAISLTLSATDPAGQGLVFDVVDKNTLGPPANVTVSVVGNQVTLTPAAGFSGSMTLLARVRGADAEDDPLNYSTDEFTLTVVAPALPAISNQTTAEGQPVSVTLNATDPTNDGLVYKIVDVTPGSPTAHYGTNVDSSGKLTITPDAGFTGTRNLVVEVRLADSPEDPASYVTQAFTLNVVGLNPVATPQTTGEGAPITITLVPSQAGGDVAYGIFDGTSFTTTVANVTITPTSTPGQFTLKPAVGFVGPITLRAGIRGASADPNDQNSYDLQTFTLTVVAPVLAAVSNQTVAVGATNSFTLHGTDNSGQGLTYKIVDATTMQPAAHLTATVDSSGNVTIVPDAGFTNNGTPLNLFAEVRETGSDDVQANYVTQPFTLTIVAPTLDTVTNQTTDSNTPKTVQLAGHDTLGNALFYKNFTTGATNVDVSVNSTTGAVTLTPHAGTTGTVTIQVGVRDNTSPDVAANYTMQSFTLTVTAPPVPARRQVWLSIPRVILVRLTAMVT